MKYKVNDEEKNIITQFQSLHIPSIFKTDNTDKILFVEDVDFGICNFLLKGKEISDAIYDETMENYKRFCDDTDIKDFDDYTLKYFKLCLEVVEIMKKYKK